MRVQCNFAQFNAAVLALRAGMQDDTPPADFARIWRLLRKHLQALKRGYQKYWEADDQERPDRWCEFNYELVPAADHALDDFCEPHDLADSPDELNRLKEGVQRAIEGLHRAVNSLDGKP